MVEGKTSNGYKFKVDERAITDWSVLEAIADIESGEVSRVIKGTTNMANALLGEKGVKDLLEHIRRKNDGYAPSEIVQNEIIEIFKAADESKK